MSANPLLVEWASLANPRGLPPFDQIEPVHFAPAFELAQQQHLEEVKAIAECEADPTFDNTALPLDRAGASLDKVSSVFSNLCASCSSSELQAVEAELAGPLAAHTSKVYFTPGLFARLDALHANMHAPAPGGGGEKRFLGLDEASVRLVDRLHLDFVRAGAKFDDAAQKRYGALVERLAVLQTTFTQAVTLDETNVFVDLPGGVADLEGCPDDLVAAARAAFEEQQKQLQGKGQKKRSAPGDDDAAPPSGVAAPLARSFVEPFLTYASKREVRQKVFEAWSRRGELVVPERDNKPVALEALRLRAEQAAMHGFGSFAAFNVADTMAQTPENVEELLARVWGPAKAQADKERVQLEQLAERQGAALGKTGVEAWDWRFYSELVRKQEFDLDEEELKPYLPLEGVLEAVFDVAFKLFGLKFVDVSHKTPSYHPDVRTFEVRQSAGATPGNDCAAAGDGEEEELVAVFLFDPFARPYKQSGAWMSEYRTQSYDQTTGLRVAPVVVNNCNFVKAAAPAPAAAAAAASDHSDGEQAAPPTLLSFDDAVTLFHEFGHGCHGMLSDVRFERLAGTSVLRDFVELPSQLMEHWLLQPKVLKSHAKHWKTGEPMPDALVAKLTASKLHGAGFATVEYVACALLDQRLHALSLEQLQGYHGNQDDGGGVSGERLPLDLGQFEQEQLAALGMPQGIILRHRLPHFQHLFSSSAYASAYYVYLWAEVLDADAFDAFLEAGDCFDPAVAKRVRECIYSVGGSVEPGAAFRNFRGRDPEVQPMLKKKLGLTA